MESAEAYEAEPDLEFLLKSDRCGMESAVFSPIPYFSAKKLKSDRCGMESVESFRGCYHHIKIRPLRYGKVLSR